MCRIIKGECMNVSDVMIKEPVFIVIPSTKAEVIRKIISHNISGMPVIKETGELVGFITRQDLLESPHEDQLALLMQWDPPCIRPSESVEKAIELLVENKIYHLPVVSAGRLVGLVSPYELLPIVEEKCKDMLVEDHLHSKCIPVWEKMPLKLLPRMIMLTDNYAMPVLNRAGELSGIITDRDLFSTSEIKEIVTKSQLGLSLDDDAWSWEGVKNIMTLFYEEQKLTIKDNNVDDVMVTKPVTVYKKSNISKAAKLMRKNYFGQLPVMDDNAKLVSMIFSLDVLGAYLDG